MWTYHQSNGTLFRDGKYIDTGYSGAGKTRAEGRNNPAMEGVEGKGPIPRGLWKIDPSYLSRDLGPICMNLEPYSNNALGRSLFRIHGNNAINDASHGCIIMQRTTRMLIANSGDVNLEVVI